MSFAKIKNSRKIRFSTTHFGLALYIIIWLDNTIFLNIWGYHLDEW
jgi:hypothetical protein